MPVSLEKSAVTAVAIIFGVMVLLPYLEKALLYPTQFVRVPDTPAGLQASTDRWWLETDQGDVEAWFLEPPRKTEPQPAVILAHGNAEAIDHLLSLAIWYRNQGFAVLLPEYRGYGRSAGSPDKDKILSDFAAFYDRLANRSSVDSEKIVFHGRSLGGGILCSLTRRHSPAKLVLQSTFTSVSDLAWEHYFAPSFLVTQDYNCEAALQNFSNPVLIIHGEEDDLIPFRHARHLHKKAVDSRLISLPECGHNNCRLPYKDLKSFLD